VLSGATVINFLYLVLMRVYISSYYTNVQQSNILVWIAVASLLMMIAIFILYELFVREESTNVALAIDLQRLNLETQFFKEIDAMYTDMRTWQHEYMNNLTALRSLVEHNAMEKALNYIDNIVCEPSQSRSALKTGNLVLDAVVSAKLGLAQSQGIEVAIHVVYPEVNRLEDNDLCAIAGNLLDNAIEACSRMSGNDEKRFINFTLLVKGKNLVLSINNSYNNELRRDGDKYLTVKKTGIHGIGIPHVDAIVRKYNGHVLRNQRHGVFETHVMLPLLLPDGGD
jgi:sensor histidine kinase regulating citrate/malate metabolism